jgi:two-component system, sensor histidine kinase LadS
VALLLIVLANFDVIESKNGRESAERALVLAASCVRGVINPGDMLARAGVSQFALLLESPVTEPEAHGIATKVLANALRSENTVGFQPEHKLRFHIAMSYVQPREDAVYREAEPLLSSLAAAAGAVDLHAAKTIISVSAA